MLILIACLLVPLAGFWLFVTDGDAGSVDAHAMRSPDVVPHVIDREEATDFRPSPVPDSVEVSPLQRYQQLAAGSEDLHQEWLRQFQERIQRTLGAGADHQSELPAADDTPADSSTVSAASEPEPANAAPVASVQAETATEQVPECRPVRGATRGRQSTQQRRGLLMLLNQKPKMGRNHRKPGLRSWAFR